MQSPNPIATFFPHKRYGGVGMISQHAFLEIESSVVDSLDTVLGAVCWNEEMKALTMLQSLYSYLLRNGESAVFEQARARTLRHLTFLTLWFPPSIIQRIFNQEVIPELRERGGTEVPQGMSIDDATPRREVEEL